MQEELYGKILGTCEVCSAIVEKKKLRSFLGMVVCRNCEWKIIKGLESANIKRLVRWLEVHLKVRIEFYRDDGVSLT